MTRRILVGVTGASGSIYAERLIAALEGIVDRVYVVVTETGSKVIQHELGGRRDGFSLAALIRKDAESIKSQAIRLFGNADLFAPVASGSSAPTDMVILPCSMGTLGRIASGASTNLLERSADVMLKESRNLIVCPRETPLNRIHLSNMLTLIDAGAKIVPPTPGFYHLPKTIDDLVDFVVGRILSLLGIESELTVRWNPRMR